MPSAVLFFAYVVVMTVALGCFVQAFRKRFDTPVHKRWGITGCLLSLGGIVTVLVLSYAMGWRVPQRFPDVVLWHRRFAYVGTILILLIMATGALRILRVHTRLYVVFFPVYVIALVLAIIGYKP